MNQQIGKRILTATNWEIDLRGPVIGRSQSESEMYAIVSGLQMRADFLFNELAWYQQEWLTKCPGKTVEEIAESLREGEVALTIQNLQCTVATITELACSLAYDYAVAITRLKPLVSDEPTNP